MTFEEKGAYMELLMMQFTRGHMGGHMIGQVVGQIWDKIRSKFVQDDHGLWYNKRLDEEKEKRNKFISSRKNNIKGKNQHSAEVGHMTSHMENANENINVLGSEKISEIANVAWKHQKWREQICMGSSLTTQELQKWMALFNASVENDKIPGFNLQKYKKMCQGWIASQQARGRKVEKGLERKSESAPLKIVHGI